MQRATTCTCRACRNIPSLDLKFIAHHGSYILQRVRDIRELVGSDVNLVHRLLKNHVSEATGWRAYVMFTEGCLEHIKLDLEEAHVQVECYEHFADVKTYSLDLRRRYQELLETRRIFVDKNEADILIVGDFSVPLPVAWDWIQDPVKRNLWGHDVTWTKGERPAGRTKSGASNHCAHGKGGSMLEVILDWHPFEYSTTETFEKGKKIITETFRFEPLPGGTRVYDIIKMEMPLPKPLRRLMSRIFSKMMHMDEMLQRAVRLAGEEYERSRQEEAHETAS